MKSSCLSLQPEAAVEKTRTAHNAKLLCASKTWQKLFGTFLTANVKWDHVSSLADVSQYSRAMFG
jgi:hypothetical protein